MASKTALEIMLSEGPAHAVLYRAELCHETPLWAAVNTTNVQSQMYADLHGGIEVAVALSGVHERLVVNRPMVLHPGDVAIHLMWEPHAFRYREPNSKAVIAIFLPEFLGQEEIGGVPWFDLLAVPPDKRPRVEREETRRQTLALGEGLALEIEQRRPGWETVVRLHLLHLLVVLWRERTPSIEPLAQAEAATSSFQRVLPVLRLLYRDSTLRVAEAAAACGLSSGHFGRIFRETMGISFRGFCLQARLTAAARALLASQGALKTIAERTGFADASHLHRVFTKHYGCTPAEYRRKFQAD